MPRWSHIDERLITLPLDIHGEDHTEHLTMKRRVTRAFTSTTPRAGVPVPGVLRVTRADGSWREINAFYLSGMSWADEASLSAWRMRAAVLLVACDPWWYGPEAYGLAWQSGTVVQLSYYQPYETVSPNRELGARTVNVESEIEVSPVWQITGPATSVTVRYEPNGPGWTFGTILAGETITIDHQAMTVTDQSGKNRIGNLAWPTSSITWSMRPGPNPLLLSITDGTADSTIEMTYRPRWETA